jgi:diadenosine tetraphosphate (Ap4A) HIT family hydrolase
MASYKSSTEKGKCVFCEIVKGSIKTPGIFWEDKQFMAFLSTWPSTEGLAVLVSKGHYGSDVLAIPDKMLQRFIVAAKKVSNVLMGHFKDVGRVGLIIEGLGVDHAHIKLIPMHGTGYMKQGVWRQRLSGKSDYFEKYEGYLTSADGPKADYGKLRDLAKKLRDVRQRTRSHSPLPRIDSRHKNS